MDNWTGRFSVRLDLQNDAEARAKRRTFDERERDENDMTMRLAPWAQAQIEEFLRAHLRDQEISLPELRVHTGLFARWATRLMRAGGFTIGRHIFVAPKLVRRDERGRLVVPGWLIVHEAVHVLQFRRVGACRLALSYVGTYWRELWRSRSLGREARVRAYFAVPEEGAAYAATEAFLNWRAQQREGARQLKATEALAVPDRRERAEE